MTTIPEIEVLAADVVDGGVLIHFSDGTSILYRARFLSDVRNEDGNVAVSDGDDLNQ